MRALDRLKDRWIKKFFLHVVTGGISVVVHYGVMGLLLRQGIDPLLSSTAGFGAGALVRFLTAYLAVFEPEESWKSALPRFLLSLVVQGAGNAGLLSLLLAFQMPVWVAQVLVTGLMTVLNFLMYRVWVFK